MIYPVKTSVTHEAQVNAWFTVDAMPAAWRAAAPDLCAQFAQILRDKAMESLQSRLYGRRSPGKGHARQCYL